jgi:uncharacterized protein (TIGR00369 family)
MTERIAQSFNRQKLMAAYGARIAVLGEGSVEITVQAKDFLLRTSGIFHGGVIAAIADTAAGYAAASYMQEDTSFLTVEFKINFLNKAKGDWLKARTAVLKSGRTLTVVSADVFILTEKAEKKVATALVTLIKETN